jgi:hypothetical protein
LEEATRPEKFAKKLCYLEKRPYDTDASMVLYRCTRKVYRNRSSRTCSSVFGRGRGEGKHEPLELFFGAKLDCKMVYGRHSQREDMGVYIPAKHAHVSSNGARRMHHAHILFDTSDL